ncbi:MAG: hypothetical protein WB500_16640, partial [Rhodoplanes sp.]
MAALALVEMLGDRNTLSFVERASRERRECDVGGVLDRHDMSPNRARNRAIANRERDLTMLRGTPGAAAISPWA